MVHGVLVMLIVAWSGGCGGGGERAGDPTTTRAPSTPPPAATPVPGGATAPKAAGPLAAVAWMVGIWVGKNGEGADVDETWSAPAGQVMSGTGRTKKGDKEVTETLRIEARDGGAIVYAAQPGTAPPTEFLLDARTSGATHAQFVNEAHDWPTRIRYERAGDELKVRVRGRPGQADDTYTLKKK